MTVDEIKRTYSMRDIVERYGIKVNRAGFCNCPFHQGDRTASLKIYKDSFHCFGCNTNGDIFTFVQKYENCDFKTAFYSLGGIYEKPTKSSQTALYRARKAQEKRQREELKIKEKQTANNTLIHAARELFLQAQPLSGDWWYYLDIYHMAIIKDINMEGGIK